MNISSTIKYYEDRKFGIYEYDVVDCYEIPHLMSSDYKDKIEYIEYREKVEKETIINIIKDNDYSKYKNTMNIIEENLDKAYNLSNSDIFKIYYNTHKNINEISKIENDRQTVKEEYNNLNKQIKCNDSKIKELDKKINGLQNNVNEYENKIKNNISYKILKLFKDKLSKIEISKFYNYDKYEIKKLEDKKYDLFSENNKLYDKSNKIKKTMDYITNNNKFSYDKIKKHHNNIRKKEIAIENSL